METAITIDDPIYGRAKITEPVLIDLINSAALQRLKLIHQTGANYFLWPEQPMRNRFEHSVGVALLLRKLGAPLEEQIAGLLHDVAHSAFSHVLDYLTDNRDHESHELKMEQFVASSEIPKILQKHGFNWHKIINHQKFSLLEQPAPALCADRVDYFLRDGLGYGVLTMEEVKMIVENLTVHQGKIITTNREIAKLIGERYLEMDNTYWATSRDALGINYALVEIIKRAIGLGLFEIEALWQIGDEEVISHLRNLNDPIINEWFEILNPQTAIIEDKNFYDVRVFPKIRLIDPPVLENGKLRNLSDLDSDFANQLREASQFPNELFLRFHQ